MSERLTFLPTLTTRSLTLATRSLTLTTRSLTVAALNV